MNHEIKLIDAKTEEIKKQIVVLRNNPSAENKQKIMELNIVLDDLLAARNNITQNYLSEIENAIKAMKSGDLTSIMQEKNIDEEEARKEMFYSFSTITFFTYNTFFFFFIIFLFFLYWFFFFFKNTFIFFI